ncbi:MAG: cereblon family protein [Desulfobacteraceae bacterium]|nr:cereblon family protein [Desulfobacteraceae bacterium]
MIRHFFEITPPLFFKSDQEKSKSPVRVSAEEADSKETDEEWYVCRNCQQPITRPSQKIIIQGSHSHTFANPSGVVFELACFSTAVGFSFMGPPSLEFTWFTGHTWRITICAGCLNHIGWFFSSTGGTGFFGLILDKLQLRALPSAEP